MSQCGIHGGRLPDVNLQLSMNVLTLTIKNHMPVRSDRSMSLSSRLAALASACALALTAGASSAQERSIAFTLGAGASVTPDYFGSDDYSIGPTGNGRVDYLKIGPIEIGSSRGVAQEVVEGFGLRGSARYIGSRKASSNGELRGLEDVDATLELGFGVGYDTRDWRVFGVGRYGFFGHESFVGQLGADAIFHPSDQLTVSFGPRADIGDSDFMQTYFGVTADEAAAPNGNFGEFSPSSGFYSVGVELQARYEVTEAWGVETTARYNRFIDDANDSPIVQQGSANAFALGVVVTRSFLLEF